MLYMYNVVILSIFYDFVFRFIRHFYRFPNNNTISLPQYCFLCYIYVRSCYVACQLELILNLFYHFFVSFVYMFF